MGQISSNNTIDISNAVKEAAILRPRDERHWLVAYVKMNHEKKTGEMLTRIGIENYIPIQKQYHKWSDRMKEIDHLVISMLVFVHAKRSERNTILSLPSVSKFITTPGGAAPAVIPDSEMQKFKYMLDYSDECIHISNDHFNVGEEVKVIKGPLAGMEGVLFMLDNKSNVGIRLGDIGYASVSMPIGYIEKIR
jgi:transcription termination/antitermination protein NusG